MQKGHLWFDVDLQWPRTKHIKVQRGEEKFATYKIGLDSLVLIGNEEFVQEGVISFGDSKSLGATVALYSYDACI